MGMLGGVYTMARASRMKERWVSFSSSVIEFAMLQLFLLIVRIHILEA